MSLSRRIDLIAGIVIVSALALWFRPVMLAPEARDESRAEIVPRMLGGNLADKNFVIVVQTSCGYCSDSMPLYRKMARVSRAAKGRSKLIVAAPEHDAAIGAYLAQHDLEPDAIINAPRGALPVTVTPTILLVDKTGRVEHRWEGMLSESEGEGVVGQLDNRGPVQ
jgi:hypothetical protein